jgi:hypothetical protein
MEAGAGLGLADRVMKRQKNLARKPAPTRGKLTVLAQVPNLIPGHLVAKLAREHGVATKARTLAIGFGLVARRAMALIVSS